MEIFCAWFLESEVLAFSSAVQTPGVFVASKHNSIQGIVFLNTAEFSWPKDEFCVLFFEIFEIFEIIFTRKGFWGISKLSRKVIDSKVSFVLYVLIASLRHYASQSFPLTQHLILVKNAFSVYYVRKSMNRAKCVVLIPRIFSGKSQSFL